MRNDERTRLRLQVSKAAWALLEKRRRDVVAMVESCGGSPRDFPLWQEIWRDKEGVHLDRFMKTEDGTFRRDDSGFMVEEAVIRPRVVPNWIPFD